MSLLAGFEGFAAFGPQKEFIGLGPTMKAMQDLIAHVEPDIVKQGLYQIHPLKNCRANIESVRVDKFDAVTGELVETVNL
jgi:hypothetical protein